VICAESARAGTRRTAADSRFELDDWTVITAGGRAAFSPQESATNQVRRNFVANFPLVGHAYLD
jgi:hypothetical protein